MKLSRAGLALADETQPSSAYVARQTVIPVDSDSRPRRVVDFDVHTLGDMLYGNLGLCLNWGHDYWPRIYTSQSL